MSLSLPRRLPPGRRGLKLVCEHLCQLHRMSPPTREAWIEMISFFAVALTLPSPPTREAWIEMDHASKAGGETE